MTDLYKIVPESIHLSAPQLLGVLDHIELSVSDILSLEVRDIAEKASLPVNETQKFKDSLVDLLHVHLALDLDPDDSISREEVNDPPLLQTTGQSLARRWRCISGLDTGLNTVLEEGIARGYLSEICGESGTGKTQTVLTLMLSVQLPPPHGLESAALYLSTEAQLPTTRLHQILESNEYLSSLPLLLRPSLSRIFGISIPDLESLDHVLNFQVPIAIQRFGVGLLVIDSLAAGYRVEFSTQKDTTNGPAMARRASHLLDLAFRLRDLAKAFNVAVVTTNQVTDNLYQDDLRVFSHPGPSVNRAVHACHSQQTMIMPRSSRTWLAPSCRISGQFIQMSLDRQQNWLIGWREESVTSAKPYFTLYSKKPSLGFVWSNQIAARIMLVKVTRAKGAESPINPLESQRLFRAMKLLYSSWPNRTTRTSSVHFIIENGGALCVS